MTLSEKIARAKADYDAVHEAGVSEGIKSAYDAFWDEFQKNGEPKQYNNAFCTGWTDVNYNPKYPITIPANTALSYLYAYNTSVTDTKVTITAPYTTVYMFYWMANCHTIRKLVVTEQTTFSDAFYYCNKLQNIVIEGVIANNIDLQWSTVLSKASIQSIVGALSTTASGKTLTLSKTAVNNAFTTAEWTALANTRSNWTISLV